MAHDGTFAAPRFALIVDDAPASQKKSMQAARELGLLPLAFGAAEEALAWIEAHGVPALVVVDVTLPRMSAFAFCGEVRGRVRTRAVPVVVVGARPGMELEDHARALELDVELASARDLAAVAAPLVGAAAPKDQPAFWTRLVAAFT